MPGVRSVSGSSRQWMGNAPIFQISRIHTLPAMSIAATLSASPASSSIKSRLGMLFPE